MIKLSTVEFTNKMSIILEKMGQCVTSPQVTCYCEMCGIFIQFSNYDEIPCNMCNFCKFRYKQRKKEPIQKILLEKFGQMVFIPTQHFSNNISTRINFYECGHYIDDILYQ
jgi:hypothetical protein